MSPFELGPFLLGGRNTTRDSQQTLPFYINLIGMRPVFAMNTEPLTIYYLRYPSTPEDRADLPGWSAHLANRRILPQALGRLRNVDVPVIKDLGVTSHESVPLSSWEEKCGVGFGKIHSVISYI
ncbi:putative lactoylglutathione lyase (Glo1) [Aspergillus lucknowensis]|uniref:Uncharacterized protein n=1 Tax=Aspergillus lucknowensis TaxID=176173 RepID=A0ABR4L994_9EURO